MGVNSHFRHEQNISESSNNEHFSSGHDINMYNTDSNMNETEADETIINDHVSPEIIMGEELKMPHNFENHSIIGMKNEKSEQSYFNICNNKFINNGLDKWVPVYTPKYLIFIYLVVGITFITIGAYLHIVSSNTIECIVGYDDSPGNGITTDTLVEIRSENCNPSNIGGGEIKYLYGDYFIYYQLRNFYQNNKSYINSRNDRQLSGELITNENELSDCYPLIKDKYGKILYPCGIAAYTIFNDTYMLFDGQNDPVEIDDSIETITFKSDRVNYKNIPENELINHQFNDWLSKEIFPGRIENPHFIVWMKYSAFSTFNKIYGKLHSKKNKLVLPLKIHIKNRYPVHLFNGSKYIVISQNTIFGGKNPYFGILYIVSGLLFIILSIYYILRNYYNNSNHSLGDFRYLYWNST
ncbi:transmembrane domain-containing protein [Cryptosporidium canis]|uniref:Transmembrane domain-containing protein n=1 Tax=Cryptosporidium canis TaxID=195482 RepID=A0ABQ8P4H6_9CRYT|nr:transmembrane domain-containing protein [Cryptosporidium canis]